MNNFIIVVFLLYPLPNILNFKNDVVFNCTIRTIENTH